MSNMAAQENFRTNLVAQCAQRDISQRDLERLSGIHFTQINRIFQGKCKPTLETCEALASALGLPLVALLVAPEKISA